MSDNSKGILLTLGSVVFFALMAVLVKIIPNVSSYQTTFFRFAIGLGIVGILAFFGVINLRFNDRKNLFWRGLIGGIAVYLFYLTIIKLGVGKGSVYIYSYPIFATLFSMIMLKEKVEPVKLVVIFISFGGLVLLSVGGGNSLDGMGIYELIGIAGSITTGLAVVFVKKLHDSDNSYAIFFSQCIMGFWLFLIPSGVTQAKGNLSELLLLVLVGVVATIGQLFMTEGYRYVNVATGSLFQSMVPVFNLFSGWLIFHEQFSTVEMTGAFVIVSSCFVLVIINFKIGKKTRILKLVE
ncbi:MAG TPA: DMT family transporter [Prolixibacteraceae bacterium]|nr:DMT family transporter [Prolixibacteraceae bacterium]